MNNDTTIIRPEMRLEHCQIRDRQMSPEKKRKLKKALRTLQTLETMAVNIYKFQITNRPSEHNRQLIAAMCNEMTHLQDFQVKLFEYGLKPSKFRFAYWLVGFFLGYFSRLLGKKAVLKTGIWVEKKAVRDYQKLLEGVDWDPQTRRIIEKDRADEKEHIRRWQSLLEN